MLYRVVSLLNMVCYKFADCGTEDGGRVDCRLKFEMNTFQIWTSFDLIVLAVLV